MEQAIKVNRKCKGGILSLSSKGKYANIKCEKKGFSIIISDAIMPDHIVRLRSFDGRLTLPPRIIKEYGIGDWVEVERIDHEKYFVRGTKKAVNPPKLFSGILYKDTTDEIDLTSVVDEYEHRMAEGKIALRNDLRLGKTRKVVMHFGNRNFIELSFATKEDEDKYPMISSIYAEYGQDLQHFVGETLTFIKKDVVDYNFNLSGVFLKNAGLISTSVVRVMKMADTSIILAPLKSECDITNEVIEPVIQRSIKTRICHDCNANLSDAEKLLQVQKEFAKERMAFEESKRAAKVRINGLLASVQQYQSDLSLCVNATNTIMKDNDELIKEIERLKGVIVDLNTQINNGLQCSELQVIYDTSYYVPLEPFEIEVA